MQAGQTRRPRHMSIPPDRQRSHPATGRLERHLAARSRRLGHIRGPGDTSILSWKRNGRSPQRPVSLVHNGAEQMLLRTAGLACAGSRKGTRGSWPPVRAAPPAPGRPFRPSGAVSDAPNSAPHRVFVVPGGSLGRRCAAICAALQVLYPGTPLEQTTYTPFIDAKTHPAWPDLRLTTFQIHRPVRPPAGTRQWSPENSRVWRYPSALSMRWGRHRRMARGTSSRALRGADPGEGLERRDREVGRLLVEMVRWALSGSGPSRTPGVQRRRRRRGRRRHLVPDAGPAPRRAVDARIAHQPEGPRRPRAPVAGDVFAPGDVALPPLRLRYLLAGHAGRRASGRSRP